MTEKQLQPKIIKWLEKNGYYTVKTIKLNKNGLPDIFAFKDGKCVMIEVKGEGQKPRPLQDFRIREVQEFGIKSFYANSFEMFLEKITLH